MFGGGFKLEILPTATCSHSHGDVMTMEMSEEPLNPWQEVTSGEEFVRLSLESCEIILRGVGQTIVLHDHLSRLRCGSSHHLHLELVVWLLSVFSEHGLAHLGVHVLGVEEQTIHVKYDVVHPSVSVAW